MDDHEHGSYNKQDMIEIRVGNSVTLEIHITPSLFLRCQIDYSLNVNSRDKVLTNDLLVHNGLYHLKPHMLYVFDV